MQQHATGRYEEDRSLLSVSELARFFGVERTTVYRITKTGELPFVRVGERIRFRPEDIERYLKRGSP